MNDYVTQDLAITLLADEEEHRREFIGFLREFERPGAKHQAAAATARPAAASESLEEYEDDDMTFAAD